MMRWLLYPWFKLYIFLTKGRFLKLVLSTLPFFRPVWETRNNQTPVELRQWLKFRVLGGKAGGAYFPIHPTSKLNGDWRNVIIGIDVSPTVSPGCYVQSLGKIFIGDYTQIAPHVGLISSNHFLLDISKHVIGEIKIGRHCRIGMGSIVLPNVVLGDFVTVAANSVVKSSFEMGYCIIGGNPAKILEDYSENITIREKFESGAYSVENKYHGFIEADAFDKYRRENLNG